MTSSKHSSDPGKDVPRPPDDLKRNPGIGSSKGSFARTGEDPKAIEADNTFEGDVENDTTPAGGVNPNHRGRTNK